MTCVKLHCPADLLKLTTVAHASRRTALQELPGIATADERRALEAVLLKRTANLLGVLNMCIITEERGTRVNDADEKTAPDAVASIAILEGEVQQIQQEVLAASQRVVQLRSSVPAALSENLREKLEQCRPACEPPAAEAGAQQDAAEDAALSPAPAELQVSFASAVLKMPTLRAKLEDALERLQRIVSAMAADAAQAPPNTVERAARGLATPAGGVPAAAAAAAAGEGAPSPKLAEALSSGKIATRRRIASNLRPVPYPKH